jgi:hypothetical protein
VEEVVLAVIVVGAEAEIDPADRKCMKLFVLSAVRDVKYLLDQAVINRFIAVNVLKKEIPAVGRIDDPTVEDRKEDLLIDRTDLTVVEINRWFG